MPSVPPATVGPCLTAAPRSPAASSPASIPASCTDASPGAPAHAPDLAPDGSRDRARAVQQTDPAVAEARQVAILDALARGTPWREICAAERCSFSTVARIAKRHAELETGAIARLMQSRALSALEHWETAMESGAKSGKHAPARDWLLHAGAIAPLQSDQGSGAKVAIIIGTPGHPARLESLQVIDTQGHSTRDEDE